MTPICNWEGLWKPSNAGVEVVFPRMNFMFRQIGVVDVGWGVLWACVLIANECFDVVRLLVVHLVKLRLQAPCCEIGIDQPVSLQELLLGPAFDWVNVEVDYVLVASVNSDGEPAQLVAEQHVGDLNNGHEDKVHTSIEGFLGRGFHSLNWFAIKWEWRWDSCRGGCFRGSFTLTRLVHVTFFSFIVDLDVLTDLARCEAGKAFQVAFVDCLYQHGDDWII